MNIEDNVVKNLGFSNANLHSVIGALGNGYVLHEFTHEADFFSSSGNANSFQRPKIITETSDEIRIFALKAKSKGYVFLFRIANLTVHSVARSSDFSGCLPYQFTIGRYLLSQGISLGEFAYEFCAIENKSGGYYFLDTEIERLETKNGCSLHSSEPVALPNVIVSDGDFTLIDTALTKSPSAIHVKGDLDLCGVTNLTLPKTLMVTGSLSIKGSDANKLYAGFKIGRDLDISYSEIKTLPNKFIVGRHIIATESKLLKIPNDLHIRGNLILKGSAIENLPHGLKIDGNLDISNTNLRTIPTDLSVSGNLYVDRDMQIPTSAKIGNLVMRIHQ